MQQAAPAEGAFRMRNKLNEEVGAIDTAQETAPGGSQHQAHAGNRAQLLFDLQGHAVHRREAGPFGRGDPHVEFALIHVAGQILLPHHLVERHGGGNDQHGQPGHHQPVRQGPPQDSQVTAVNSAIETAA